ncbi:MAG: NAD(P)-binding domain-containing protein [Gemmatimonadales bacterium]
MDTLLTSIAFFALTALLVYRHLRKTEGAPAPRPAAPAGHPCPRCRHVVPADSTFCPGCGVPQQIFEVVSAPAAGAASGSGEDPGGRLHAVVRADMCVGCATCVAACPETGALAMQGKLAVVNQSACVGHSSCAAACPVGAILLTTGAAVHRVEVPELGPDFQTCVPGLYIVGELGGRGLIKNAINEGKVAIEYVTARVPDAGDPDRLDDGVLDVLVVGAGPAGLSAGLEAHRVGLRYVVLEQGTLADTVRKYPRHKLLFAEPITVPLYGDLWIADASKESLLQVWETIVANTGLQVETNTKVDNISREHGDFLITSGNQRFRARHVVLAMGRRGSPRRLGVPGEESAKVVYDIAEMEDFQGRKVLVVGGGDSAVESALGLANQEGTTVGLSYRGEDFKRVKERNRQKLDAAVKANKVTLYLRSQLREIRQDRVVMEVDGQTSILPNDDVIVRIGGDAPYAFLQRIGVRIVQKELPIPMDLERVG